MPLVEVPAARLGASALDGLIEEYVTREGTEYGARDYTLEEKKAEVLRAMKAGEVLIVFDTDSEACTLVLARDLPRAP